MGTGENKTSESGFYIYKCHKTLFFKYFFKDCTEVEIIQKGGACMEYQFPASDWLPAECTKDQSYVCLKVINLVEHAEAGFLNHSWGRRVKWS